MLARDERGVVTAETAMVLPLLVAVAFAMAWLVSLGLAQMQVADAAREAARAVARGDDATTAHALAMQAAPGSSVDIDRADGTVRVTVRRRVTPPGGLLDALAGVTAEARATALDEDGQ